MLASYFYSIPPTAGCCGIDPCTPGICERLSTPSDESYACIMLRRSITLKTAVGGTASCGILPLVLLGKAYPANHAPWVEVARKLTLVAVARHQHDDAPLVDVLQVHGGCGPQIAREDFGGFEHHLLPDSRLRYFFL